MIKNKIMTITEKEVNELTDILKGKNCFIVVLDGMSIKKKEAYMEIISKKFKFPEWDRENLYNLSAYSDWMRDGDGFNNYNSVAIIIKNYSEFLVDDLEFKAIIMKMFINILYFWDTEVEQVVVGGVATEYNIYLVD